MFLDVEDLLDAEKRVLVDEDLIVADKKKVDEEETHQLLLWSIKDALNMWLKW